SSRKWSGALHPVFLLTLGVEFPFNISAADPLHSVWGGGRTVCVSAVGLHQRSGLVLCRHHDGHPSHAGDVGGSDRGGGQRWGGGGSLEVLRLAVGLREHLGLGQLAVALWPGEGAAVGAGLRGEGPPPRQGAVVV
ncbi:hypothetical protein NQZ68_015993, partial [Dissostichus eleginoides]